MALAGRTFPLVAVSRAWSVVGHRLDLRFQSSTAGLALSKRGHRDSGLYDSLPGPRLEFGCVRPAKCRSGFDGCRPIGRRERLDIAPPRALAPDRFASGRRMVSGLFALSVGCGIARPHRPAGRGNTCVARLQPASLRSQCPGQCALRVVAGTGSGARRDSAPGPMRSRTNFGTLASMNRIRQTFYLLMMSGLAQVLTSCAPKANEAPLNSQFFSRVQVLGTRGTGLGQFNKPRSVALDRQDNLFVVDMTGRVQKFSHEGRLRLSWPMPQTDKGKPKGMCRDAQGNIVVLEPHYSRVNHFSTDGKLARQWGDHGTNAGQLAFPRAVAVDEKGNVFVSEYGL